MRCPFCAFEDTQVKDSRPAEAATTIRRRRFCGNCNGKFTTFERMQIKELQIIKRNGQAELFEREKLLSSMRLALRKRPVSREKLELAVTNLTRQIESSEENSLTSQQLGAMVMEILAALDPVAYVRFASVYHDFHRVEDFANFIQKSAGQVGADLQDAKKPFSQP